VGARLHRVGGMRFLRARSANTSPDRPVYKAVSAQQLMPQPQEQSRAPPSAAAVMPPAAATAQAVSSQVDTQGAQSGARAPVPALSTPGERLLAKGLAALAEIPADERGTSWLINDVGELLRETGRLEEARALFEEALDARRGSLGDDDPATLTSLNNLGLIFRELHELER
jgi:hypothetical protein